jgi:hypothetical protein
MPAMPELDPLPASRTFSVPLQPIFRNESTNENTLLIIDDIYLRQLGFRKENEIFNKAYMIVNGDLKTLLRVQSVQNIRAGTSTAESPPYDGFDWIIPNPGLFHLQLNLLRLIHRAHWGAAAGEPQEPDDFSTLQWAADSLNRSNVREAALMEPLEELIIHSYQARIVAALIRAAHRVVGFSWKDFHRETVEEYLAILDERAYRALLSQIYKEVNERPSGLDASGRLDDEWQNHIRFIQHTQIYLLLKWSIKHADLKLLRQSLRLCCIIFQAPSGAAGNYARELIRYLNWVDTDATEKELQDAILANALVNPGGRKDSFYPFDRHLEHLNLQIRNSLNDHRAAFDRSAFISRAALNSPYHQIVKDAVENVFGLYNNSIHKDKSAADDILNTAYALAEHSMIKKPNRLRLYNAPDLFHEGLSALGEAAVKFNARNGLQWEEGEFDDENGAFNDNAHSNQNTEDRSDLTFLHPDIETEF